MHIQVSGKQIDLSDALKHRVNTHLGILRSDILIQGYRRRSPLVRPAPFLHATST